jgi:hypothetical protein
MSKSKKKDSLGAKIVGRLKKFVEDLETKNSRQQPAKRRAKRRPAK